MKLINLPFKVVKLQASACELLQKYLRQYGFQLQAFKEATDRDMLSTFTYLTCVKFIFHSFLKTLKFKFQFMKIIFSQSRN